MDGSLARFRHIERPAFGYFVDHSCDGLALLLILAGLGLSPFVRLDVALFALDMIPDARRRAEVRERLAVNGRRVIELSERQVREFAGNAVELAGRWPDGRRRTIMAMSARAKRSLTDAQIALIEESCEIVAVDIPTIELAGGSVRCMIAGIHLDPRPAIEPELTEAVEAIAEEPESMDGAEAASQQPVDA